MLARGKPVPIGYDYLPIGYDCLHVAVDDHSRVADIEPCPTNATPPARSSCTSPSPGSASTACKVLRILTAKAKVLRILTAKAKVYRVGGN